MKSSCVKRLIAERALLPDGWATNVAIDIDDAGTIASVVAGAPGALGAPGDAALASAIVERAGTVVPGMANVHSHAFQRAMAGRGERRSAAADGDDFWSWREAMYELAGTLEPEALQRIATETYRAMLRAGYTTVAEFHYLHRERNGAWYADKSRMSEALVAAAREAGIAICLLPTLYAHAGPPDRPLQARQARFASGVDDVLEIANELRARFADDPNVVVGACAHSLRAVTPDALRALVDGSPTDVPIHLHVAEQDREVAEIQAAYGARPIELLLASFDVDERWCLVHATQATDDELRGIARSGAVVGLCPTTEANLGDGVFGLPAYLAADGAFGIGSDSNVSISPVEELRLLEYGQRLVHKRRIVTIADRASCGDTLYGIAARDGARACGRRAGSIAAEMHADLVELPHEDVPEPLDHYVFAALRQRPIRVMTNGRWRDVP